MGNASCPGGPEIVPSGEGACGPAIGLPSSSRSSSSCCSSCDTPARPLCKQIGRLEGEGSSCEKYTAWDFNALAFSGTELMEVAIELLGHNFAASGGNEPDVLPRFALEVRRGYLDNPFHNFRHAVDVLQSVFRLGMALSWVSLLSAPVRFSLMVVALCHDVGHPGVSNDFLVDARHALALRYNDISPLENMHCSKFFELVQEDRCNVFIHVPRSQWGDLRKLMINLILHTDLSRNGEVRNDIDALYAANAEVFASGVERLEPTPEQAELFRGQQNLVARAMICTADLSNVSRPWDTARMWASSLLEEFFRQGDKQRALGMPVQSLHDRRGATRATLPEMELNFLQFITPFFATQVRVFQPWCELAAHLAANSQAWARLRSGECGEEALGSDARAEKIFALLKETGTPLRWPELVSEAGCEERTRLHSDQALSIESNSEPRRPSEMTSGGPEVSSEPMVREVRRWWQGEESSTGKLRELVLLYVTSPEASKEEVAASKIRYGNADDQGEEQPSLQRPALSSESEGSDEQSCTNTTACRSWWIT